MKCNANICFRTSRPSGYHCVFVFGTPCVQIPALNPALKPALKPALLTEVSHGFYQYLHENAKTVP